MTKSQIWVASFLVVFLILFFLGRVSKNVDSENGQTTTSPMPQSNMTSEDLSGQELTSKLGCVNCHGTELNGTKMGPSLHNVKDNWTRDNLINYLRNPSSYMDSDRFKEFKRQYPGVIMPSFNNIQVKDLGKVAEYLLGL